jgi:cell wall-active antibiotic response 4TMS protein YvqF
MTPGGGPYDWRQMRDQRRMQHRQWIMQRAEWRRQHPGHGHAVAGAILLIVGVAFLLANMGVFPAADIRRYWPVLLIVWGAFSAVGYRRFGHNLLWGGTLMVTGGLLLVQNFGYIHGDMWKLIWPVILIFLGLSFLLRRALWHSGLPPGVPGVTGDWPLNPGVGPGPNPNPGGSANVLNETMVFGGINRRIDSQEFEGGYLSAVFGGIELDLRKANTKKDEITIEANAVFGGIELTVPEHWRVTVRGSGVFGGYDDQTHPSPAATVDEKRPHLIVIGSAVFGGVSVKN